MAQKNKKVAFLAATAVAEGPIGNYGTGNTLLNGVWWVPYNSVGSIANWGGVPATSSIPAEFIRHFNTYITGTSSAVIGYLNETAVPYSTNLDNIVWSGATGSQKNVSGNIVALPTGQSNIIGWTNPTAGTQGYYKGSESTHDFEIYRIVTVETATAVHLIKVTAQNVTFTPEDEPDFEHTFWRSAISYEYTTVYKPSPLQFGGEDVELQALRARLEAAFKK